MNEFFYWLPRGLAILITAVLYTFVLEGFAPGFGWGAALMHFMLATVVLLVTILAWKIPFAGGLVFLIVGGASIVFTVIRWALGPTVLGWDTFIAGGIPALTGILFMVEGWRKRIKS